MTDVKTGIGMAKAWVRLALEKKQLSKHLRALLSDQSILRGLYKRSAFLRCEEEKEQFLYHLLSLNAVDYFCFTSTYATTVIPYRIVIVPNKKGATTSANAWVVLSGTLSETRRIPVPKTTMNFDYKHHNLGVLTTLRLGHDNSGLYARWMIDYVLVRNEITGHTYKFPCGRWLGRGVDDGSTERLLVGSLMPTQVEGEELNQSGSMGRTPPRCRSPGPPRTELKQSQIQHMLGDCVNNIVKWHYRRNSERNTTLTALLCGENGLVHCLENVFFLGFKSARLFVGKNHLWDYFGRCDRCTFADVTVFCSKGQGTVRGGVARGERRKSNGQLGTQSPGNRSRVEMLLSFSRRDYVHQQSFGEGRKVPVVYLSQRQVNF
jgi:hypothetical protein